MSTHCLKVVTVCHQVNNKRSILQGTRREKQLAINETAHCFRLETGVSTRMVVQVSKMPLSGRKHACFWWHVSLPAVSRQVRSLSEPLSPQPVQPAFQTKKLEETQNQKKKGEVWQTGHLSGKEHWGAKRPPFSLFHCLLFSHLLQCSKQNPNKTCVKHPSCLSSISRITSLGSRIIINNNVFGI